MTHPARATLPNASLTVAALPGPTSAQPTSAQPTAAQSPGYQGIYQPGQAGMAGLKPVRVQRVKPRTVQRSYLLMDDSGSMSGQKAHQANEAASAYMQALSDPQYRDGHLVSVISFDDQPILQVSAVKPSEVIGKAYVSGQGGTCIGAALELARDDMPRWTPGPMQMEVAAPICTLMTDGCTSDAALAERVANELKGQGVVVVAVAVGDDADVALLSRLASDPALCVVVSEASGSKLRAVYQIVGQTVGDSANQSQPLLPALVAAFKAAK